MKNINKIIETAEMLTKEVELDKNESGPYFVYSLYRTNCLSKGIDKSVFKPYDQRIKKVWDSSLSPIKNGGRK